MDAKDIKAIIEIFSKPFLFDRLIDIFVCGSDNADINTDHTLAANPLKFPFLKHSQQFGLQIRFEFADLVQ